MPIGMLFFLLIPVAGQVYVSLRVWQILALPVWAKLACVALMTLAFALFFVAVSGVLDRLPMRLASCIYEVGTSWVFVLLYLFLCCLVLELGRLVWGADYLHHNLVLTIALPALLLTVFSLGNLHYRHKYVESFTLTTDKPLERPLTLVLLSDLHLGYHNRRPELARWVDMINSQKPDLVLIAGDVVDLSHRPLADDRMADELRRITAPVYVCPGNHDYLSGEPRSEAFFREAGFHLLRDSVTTAMGLSIVGRDDRTNSNRLPLQELTRGLDPNTYSILIDHQPYHLEEAEACHIDFQFSGHTHEGQVWPLSIITNAIYEQDYGHHQRGRTRYYISSGLGIWGGKFRIGTRSELVVMKLNQAN